jgi:hypothetical protein
MTETANHVPQAVRYERGKRSSVVGLVANVLLGAGKLVATVHAGAFTRSARMLTRRPLIPHLRVRA